MNQIFTQEELKTCSVWGKCVKKGIAAKPMLPAEKRSLLFSKYTTVEPGEHFLFLNTSLFYLGGTSIWTVQRKSLVTIQQLTAVVMLCFKTLISITCVHVITFLVHIHVK